MKSFLTWLENDWGSGIGFDPNHIAYMNPNFMTPRELEAAARKGHLGVGDSPSVTKTFTGTKKSIDSNSNLRYGDSINAWREMKRQVDNLQTNFQRQLDEFKAKLRELESRAA